MVPAVPEAQPHSHGESNFVCVGLDPMSAADELVSDMASNLKSVVGRWVFTAAFMSRHARLKSMSCSLGLVM